MIMKRKLPSQANKPENNEHLATTHEAENKPAKEQQSASAVLDDDLDTLLENTPAPKPPVPETNDTDVVDDVTLQTSTTADDFGDDLGTETIAAGQEDAEANFHENDIKFDLSGTPFSMPEDIPDPFVSGNFDESEMVMEAPQVRPSQPAPAPEPITPPKKSFSTEALVDDTPAPPSAAAIEASAKANLSSADSIIDDEGFMDAPVNNPSPGAAASSDNGDNWDLGELVDIPSGPSASSVLDDEGDRSPFDSGPKVDSPKAPPWKQKKTGERTLLPGEQVPSNSNSKGGSFSPSDGGSKVGGMVSIGIVIALVVGTAIFYQNRDSVIEALSRWTGTLNSVSQEVPPVAEVTPDTTPKVDSLPTEAVVRADELAAKNGDTPQTADVTKPVVTPAPTGDTKLEILDVAPDEAKEPIVADEETEMPEDVDRFAALQQAIERKRAERRKKTSAHLEDEAKDLDPKSLPPEVVTKRNMDIIKETNTALEEYKKALANVGNPALKPRPGDFFEGRQNGELPDTLQPPTTRDTAQTQAPQQQLETYGNKIIEDPSELVTPKKQDDGIRKLDDFDIGMFQPESEQVRMPRDVAPSLSAATFPPLEVLSFVPDYGIVGLNRGQEGVLLIGESLEGWELVSVFDAYAEFRKGELKKIVTIKDANR